MASDGSAVVRCIRERRTMDESHGSMSRQPLSRRSVKQQSALGIV